MKRHLYFGSLMGAIALAAAAGIIQRTNLLNIAGVKPNLTLVLLVILAFYVTDFASYLTVVFVAGLMLRFEPALDIATVVLAVIAIAAFFMRDRLPGKAFFNALALIAVSSFLFYLAVDADFLARNVSLVLAETVYNVVVGTFMFAVCHKALRYETGFRTAI